MTKTIKFRKFKWNSEKILSISAILVSIGTFLVFAYQTNLIREQQYMSVYPHLQIENHHVNSPNYKLVLRNNGIGPALVISTKVCINGKCENQDLVSYLSEKILYSVDSINFWSTNVYQGMLIPQNESVEIIKLVTTSKPGSAEKMYGLIYNDSLDFIIEYESIYGEKWKLGLNDLKPLKIK